MRKIIIIYLLLIINKVYIIIIIIYLLPLQISRNRNNVNESGKKVAIVGVDVVVFFM